MRFVADESARHWLREFVPDSDRFDWDHGNAPKTAKHGVRPEEVESIFFYPYLFAGRIAEPAHDEWRGLILGQGAGGRPLALIFTRRGERLRPISCRPMREKEKDLYEENL